MKIFKIILTKYITKLLFIHIHTYLYILIFIVTRMDRYIGRRKVKTETVTDYIKHYNNGACTITM